MCKSLASVEKVMFFGCTVASTVTELGAQPAALVRDPQALGQQEFELVAERLAPMARLEGSLGTRAGKTPVKYEGMDRRPRNPGATGRMSSGHRLLCWRPGRVDEGCTRSGGFWSSGPRLESRVSHGLRSRFAPPSLIPGRWSLFSTERNSITPGSPSGSRSWTRRFLCVSRF